MWCEVITYGANDCATCSMLMSNMLAKEPKVTSMALAEVRLLLKPTPKSEL